METIAEISELLSYINLIYAHILALYAKCNMSNLKRKKMFRHLPLQEQEMQPLNVILIAHVNHVIYILKVHSVNRNPSLVSDIWIPFTWVYILLVIIAYVVAVLCYCVKMKCHSKNINLLVRCILITEAHQNNKIDPFEKDQIWKLAS